MLRISAALALTLLSACKQEPDFDERYTAAQQRLNAKVTAIDKELAAAQSKTANANSAAEGKTQSQSSAELPNH